MAGIGGKIVLALMAFMTIGAFVQLATLDSIEDKTDSVISRRRISEQAALTNGGGTTGLSEGVQAPSWANSETAIDLRVGKLMPEVLSWKPRIILYHNFLSDEECDHIVNLGRPRMEKSTVVDQDTGKSVLSTVRTSSGMFMDEADRKDPVIARIEKRIAHYSMIPYENGELLQVLRYEFDQFYVPHHDWFDDEWNLKRGGQRVATMLMYLSSDIVGGETIFPDAENAGMCSCGGEMKKGICVQPKKGNAVLFWSTKLDGKTDDLSLHGGCKVISGEKWSSTKWMREAYFE
eukprot:TRINITY_DN22309_c0_g1_i1.p1 TRINITY_DN22309_c0_g1~~TRINITY_DN22309_c0_g1_i1.p1  ORF type:complete len:291 (-),score=44.96 TRINITY_DN22309_c0_g1_i1:32-904(-)